MIQNLQVASSNCTYTLDTLSQEVIARIFELELPRIGTPDSIFYRMTKDLKKRRDVMIQTVTECGMKPIIPDAGIFLIANWRCMGKLHSYFVLQSNDCLIYECFEFKAPRLI